MSMKTARSAATITVTWRRSTPRRNTKKDTCTYTSINIIIIIRITKKKKKR